MEKESKYILIGIIVLIITIEFNNNSLLNELKKINELLGYMETNICESLSELKEINSGIRALPVYN